MRTVATIVIALGIALGLAAGRPAAAEPDLLYVCIHDDAKVAVVDMAAKKVIRTVDVQKLGFPATAKPDDAVVEPDGSFWYLSLVGANRVIKLDQKDKIVGQYEMETPGMLALGGAGQLVATRSMSAANPPSRIAVIDRKTMKGEEVEVPFARPHPIAATQAGFAYTGSLSANQIASISLADQHVNVVNVAGPTHSFVQFTTTRDGSTLVTSTAVSGSVLVFDLSTPASPLLIKTVPVGKMASDPVYSPDEKFVWIPLKSSNELVILNSNSWRESARIQDPNLKQPQQIAFSADGATAFVTNNDKAASLVVINATTLKVEKAIPLGNNLTGMGARARR